MRFCPHCGSQDYYHHPAQCPAQGRRQSNAGTNEGGCFRRVIFVTIVFMIAGHFLSQCTGIGTGYFSLW